MPVSYRSEVRTKTDGTWYANDLSFATEVEAACYATDLMMRWTAVHDARVVESDEPPTHAWTHAVGAVRLPDESDHPLIKEFSMNKELPGQFACLSVDELVALLKEAKHLSADTLLRLDEALRIVTEEQLAEEEGDEA